MTTTRARFKVQSVLHHERDNRIVNMVPVTDQENPNGFWKYTPSGKLELGLSGDCKAEFKPGQEFFLDFTPAE